MKLLEVRDSDVDGKILEDCCGCLTVQTLVRWFSKFFLALGRAWSTYHAPLTRTQKGGFCIKSSAFVAGPVAMPF